MRFNEPPESTANNPRVRADGSFRRHRRRPTYPLLHSARRKPRRWPLVLRFIKGAIHGAIIIPIVCHAMFAVAIVCLHRYAHVDLDVPGTIIPSLSIVVGLMLVFRNQTSYNRFWDGRTNFTVVITAVRNLVRTITTTSYVKGSKPSEAELADIERTVRILIAIPYTVKNHLRAEWGAAFAKNTSDISNSAEVANPKYNPEYADLLPPAMEGHEDQGLGLPLQLTFFVDGFVKRAFDRGWYGAPQASQLQVQLNTLTDAYGKMEMIRMTPFPVAHLIHARQVLALYGAVLPFAMVDELGWWTVPIVTLIIFTLYGIEGIGSQLEDPFGYDRNDIKMDAIAEDARIEMTVTLEEWKRVSRSSDLSSEMFIEPRRASLR